MNAIAIDLGSANSMVARLNRQGIPTLVPDERAADRFVTPSLIHVDTNGAFVGHAAEVASLAQPESLTIQDFESALASGQTFEHAAIKKTWSAEDCVTLLLSKLRQDACVDSLETVDKVVLTVPSRLGSVQRRALRQAAQGAGLQVRALVDECLAAATYAASQTATATTQREQTILVIEAGRSGFEAAIVRCSQAGASLIAARHSSALGGKSIDVRLAGEICRAQGWIREALSPAASKQLLQFAEQLKVALCRSEPGRTSTGQVRLQGVVGPSTIDFVLTPWHLHELVAPLLKEATELIETCLAAADLDAAKIDRVVFAGGTTQLPALRNAVIQQFAFSADCVMDKDCLTAVAYGAALLAAQSDEQLARYDDLPMSVNVSSVPAQADDATIAQFDVGIRIGDPRTGQAAVYKLIKRGTALPAQASKQFRTSRTDQRRLVIEAVRTTGSIRRAESAGHFSLALPADLPAGYPVMVTLYCDAAGQVRFEADTVNQ